MVVGRLAHVSMYAILEGKALTRWGWWAVAKEERGRGDDG